MIVASKVAALGALSWMIHYITLTSPQCIVSILWTNKLVKLPPHLAVGNKNSVSVFLALNEVEAFFHLDGGNS